MQVETAGMYDCNCHLYNVIKEEGKMRTLEKIQAPYNLLVPPAAQIILPTTSTVLEQLLNERPDDLSHASVAAVLLADTHWFPALSQRLCSVL